MRYRFLRFPDGKAKAFTMSYDDNPPQDRRLLETLTRYGIRGTINVCDCWYDNWNDRPAPEETRALVDAGGHEIAQHCYNHVAPSLSSPCTVMREVITGRQALERRFDRLVRGMAYPDCGILRFDSQNSYETTRQILQNAGVAYSRSLGADNNRFQLPSDWYNWIPTAHHGNPQLFPWLDAFLAANPKEGYAANGSPLLFYVWGHSYEFDRDNNWELLEELCRRAGGQDQVWYATNIEIHDYVAAYEALRFNVDETLVYNPGRETVWFATDEREYCVKGGETLRL